VALPMPAATATATQQVAAKSAIKDKIQKEHKLEKLRKQQLNETHNACSMNKQITCNLQLQSRQKNTEEYRRGEQGGQEEVGRNENKQGECKLQVPLEL